MVAVSDVEEWLADELLQRIDCLLDEKYVTRIAIVPADAVGIIQWIEKRAGIHETDGGSPKHEAQVFAMHDALGHFFLPDLTEWMRKHHREDWATYAAPTRRRRPPQPAKPATAKSSERKKETQAAK